MSPGPDETVVMYRRPLAELLLTAAPSPGLSAAVRCLNSRLAVAGCCSSDCLCAGVSRTSFNLDAVIHFPRASLHLSPPTLRSPHHLRRRRPRPGAVGGPPPPPVMFRICVIPSTNVFLLSFAQQKFLCRTPSRGTRYMGCVDCSSCCQTSCDSSSSSVDKCMEDV